MDRKEIETVVRQVLTQWMEDTACVRAAKPAQIRFTEEDRLDTGNPSDRVYTHDLFTLQQSPRLGAGVMEMTGSTFDWTLHYDELDYVLEGTLTVCVDGRAVTAGPGEMILIPKDSSIQFSAPQYARFLYVTYPADWQAQT